MDESEQNQLSEYSTTPAASTTPGQRGGFGLYKYGRGYWVRVLTALCLGILFLSGAGWLWKQLEAFPLPAKGYTMIVAAPPAGVTQATPVKGQSLKLVGTAEGKDVELGSAAVTGYETAGGRDSLLFVDRPVLANEKSVLDAKIVTIGDSRLSVSRVSPVPVFERVYLQAGAAALTLLSGLVLIYRYVGRNPPSVDFLIATDEEMHKVHWSTRKHIVDSTWVVISATFLIAALIFACDTFLKYALLDRFMSRG